MGITKLNRRGLSLPLPGKCVTNFYWLICLSCAIVMIKYLVLRFFFLYEITRFCKNFRVSLCFTVQKSYLFHMFCYNNNE